MALYPLPEDLFPSRLSHRQFGLVLVRLAACTVFWHRRLTLLSFIHYYNTQSGDRQGRFTAASLKAEPLPYGGGDFVFEIGKTRDAS